MTEQEKYQEFRTNYENFQRYKLGFLIGVLTTLAIIELIYLLK